MHVKFNTNEDPQAVEAQLSEITGVKVMSLTNEMVSSYEDGQWHAKRTMALYGLDHADFSLVSGSDLEKSVEIVFT